LISIGAPGKKSIETLPENRERRCWYEILQGDHRGAPRQNFWVGQICGLRPTFYKRSMAYNSQHWEWGQTEILWCV